MSNVIPISGAERAPKSEQSRMDTLIVTPAMVGTWKLPPFQRPLRINDKVRAASEKMKKSECIEGTITLGKLKGGAAVYLVDGQHRIEAFKLSELTEAFADIRVCEFDNMAEMADEFVMLNSALVKMRPDDVLRGLESSSPAMQMIRKSCEFVGYDQIRRNSASPILSMSALIRCWTGAGFETPTTSNSGQSAATLAQNLDASSVQNMVTFISTAHAAWGRDSEYYRLWGNLNLTVCMWLWHKLVLDRDRFGNTRYAVLNITDFKRCLMSLSADADYLAWLPGRNLSDRDRSPCYSRVKTLFGRRLASESGGKKILLPAPAWASK